jgi:CRISPR-associated protein Cmr1
MDSATATDRAAGNVKRAFQPLRYQLVFCTPAFVGNAEQNGAWRTPPIKHALREWWRVAYAAERQFRVDVQGMRREEGQLFGNAWLSHREGDREVADHSKSLVRLRLDRWQVGELKKGQWPDELLVTHSEVKDREGRSRRIGSMLYLGYGPLEIQGNTALKKNAAIQANEQAGLAVAFDPRVDEVNRRRLLHALWLMDRYGTLGGRSRNGWGSYALEPQPGTPSWETMPGASPLRPWKQCLALDWPHAVGQDERGALVWQTAPHDKWDALMKTLAEVKIALRTEFGFTVDAQAGDVQRPKGVEHGKPQQRHWLAYPVTNHGVRPWGKEARLPNQLRFKVRKAAENKLVGIVFHMPHLPPAAFGPQRHAIEEVWTKVHRFLDQPDQRLTRAQA